MANHHNHNRGCGSCDDHGCACDTVVDREIIQEHISFGVTVNGDYEADPDDVVILVQAGRIVNGVLLVPAITLPAPADVDQDYPSLTIIAQGGDVRVNGLNDVGRVNIDGLPSTGSRFIAGGTAVKFWFTPLESDDCSCAQGYWIAECCSGLTSAPAAA